MNRTVRTTNNDESADSSQHTVTIQRSVNYVD